MTFEAPSRLFIRRRRFARFVTGAVAAALLAGAGSAAAQVAPLPLPPPVPATQPDLPPQFQPFELDRSNRVSVKVAVNGTGPYYFLIDTGAERSVISHDLARALQLEAGPPLTLATIAGRHEATSFYVERLETGGFAIDALEAPALQRRHLGAQGLIGLDGLNGHRVVMDFDEDRMTVEDTGRKLRSGIAADGTIVVNAQRVRGRMVIHQALINGITVDLVLDTGAQTSIGNGVLRDRLLARRGTKTSTGSLQSVTGDSIASTIALAKRIEIGGITVQNLPISFADAYAFRALDLHEKPALLLGMDVISLFSKITIDFDKRQVQFTRPGARTATRRARRLADSSADRPLRRTRGARIDR